MSVPTAALRLMADYGLSVDQIIELSAALDEKAVPDALARRRAYDRQRKAEMRKSGGKSGGQNADMSGGMSTGNPPDTPFSRVRDNSSLTVLSGKKEKRESSRSVRLSNDWEPSDDGLEYARKQGLDEEEIERALADFRDYWCALGGPKGCKLDWAATWRRWTRTASDRKRERAARLDRRPPAGGNGSGITSFVDIIAERRSRAGH
jgi:DnaT-like ssDNA binding protein